MSLIKKLRVLKPNQGYNLTCYPVQCQIVPTLTDIPLHFVNLFQINQSTGAHCEIDKNAPPDSRDKNFVIRGSPDAVERAKNMILDKLGGGGGEGERTSIHE